MTVLGTGAGKSRPRRLLLCLDGVPHSLILRAKSRGLFAKFGSPSRLFSPFPTMTNVALSAMYRATAPAGYESLYFDRDIGELRGGIRKYLGRRTPDKIPSSYMDHLDYQEPLAFEFLIYVAPERVWRADMRRFKERFRAAPQNRDYFAFLKGTDGLLHAQGADRLAVALESLDQILSEISEWCGDETEIMLFSDHGMNLEENRRVSLADHLRRNGFNPLKRLTGTDRNGVALPAFGLCSYAAAYCAEKEFVPNIATILADAEGVDFVVYRDASSVRLQSHRGAARIERQLNSQGSSYQYVDLGGDPLRLDDVVDSLTGENKLDQEGFGSDDIWFAATTNHCYPDALANIYASLFSTRVQHQADILLSLKDGYYYGWSPFERMVRLLATHGNALQASTNAFLMSTSRTLPDVIRADNASEFLKG